MRAWLLFCNQVIKKCVLFYVTIKVTIKLQTEKTFANKKEEGRQMMSVQRLFRRNRETYNEKIQRLGNVLAETDTIVIGAASGNENSLSGTGSRV